MGNIRNMSSQIAVELDEQGCFNCKKQQKFKLMHLSWYKRGFEVRANIL